MDADPLNPRIPNAGTLYVLDAHGMIFQMYHGVGPMSAPDGRPTNAVFGVTRAIMDLYDHGADYLIAAFDRPEKTFREELFSNYKAQRPPAPQDLIAQEPMIHRILEAMRIPILSAVGYEADDVMATLASEGAARGLAVFLCTSDKDCRQLLSDQVTILNLRKKDRIDTDVLMKDWGVHPKQVVDFQTLVGDSVDNVPGVPGVGPKTAMKWLQQYGTLDNLAAHADEIGGPKLRDALKKAIADGSLETSRKLVKLDNRVPLEFDWDGWKRRNWDSQRLLELFQEYGFRSFANRVRQTLTNSGSRQNSEMLAVLNDTVTTFAETSSPPRPDPGRPSLFDAISESDENDGEFAFGALAIGDTWGNTTYGLVNTEADFDVFLKNLKGQNRLVFDLETTSLDPLRAEIVGIAFAWTAAEAWYIALHGPENSTTLDPTTTLSALKPIFENSHVEKSNQNIKYEQLVLRNHGIELAGVVGDPMVADYLLHAGERSHNLDELTRRYLKHENIPITDLIGKKGKNQVTIDKVELDKVKNYACEDADAAIRLAAILEPELDKQGLRPLYDTLEIPLIHVLAEMEYNGIRLDIPYLKSLSIDMESQLVTMEREIHRAAGRPFNIASPKQLREILFDEMKLPIQKRTGTTNEPSTDSESLEKLAALGHELPKSIIEYRGVAKLKGTYVDALPELVNPKTGRIHTSFNQTVAATGRLSSSDPNLQNVPARTEQGRQIRQAFIPRDGWRILTADYSQIELRLLTHFCGDEQMIAAFSEDQDIHARVAAEIFRVTESDVTAAQRRVAKMVNFGVIYGISPFGLAVRLGIARKDAEQFIDDYFSRYPKVLEYQNSLLRKAAEVGYVSTILGRRRAFTLTRADVTSPYRGRTAAAREAINMEIQGSAADLLKLAMLAVHRRFANEMFEAKMLLTVHDELVFEVPPHEISPVATAVRTEMTSAMTLNVPLKVDVSAGRNWLEVDDV